MMIGNTVHHWELLPKNPSAAYTLERKQDPETKLFYWDMQPTDLPENNIIPLNAIVVLTKPSSIFVPTGITISNDNPQWILPTIYATKTINAVAPALAALNVRQFFGPISLTRKKATDTYYSTQINTHQ